MKSKRVLLTVEPSGKAMDRAFSALKHPSKKMVGVEVISFPDFETLGRVITGARLQLLSAIRLKKPRSIQDLAKIVGRNFKNVYDDVKLLAEFGLIELKESGPRRAAIPQARFSEIILAA